MHFASSPAVMKNASKSKEEKKKRLKRDIWIARRSFKIECCVTDLFHL